MGDLCIIGVDHAKPGYPDYSVKCAFKVNGDGTYTLVKHEVTKPDGKVKRKYDDVRISENPNA